MFLDNKIDEFLFDDKDWRLDETYRKAFSGRYYANTENAKIMKTFSKTIYEFKNNTKVLFNGQSRSIKFKNSDLIETAK